MKLYAIYNENHEIIYCEKFEEGEQPVNATDKLPNGELLPMYDYLNDLIYEGATNEEVVEFKINQNTENEFNLYLKRKQDGEIAYLKLSAEFRLAKLAGQISEETHSYLEELLTPVRNEVMFGQWKKGLEILENLGSTQIGTQLYDRLHLQISTYINENY